MVWKKSIKRTVSPGNAVRIKQKLTECSALLLEAYCLAADDRLVVKACRTLDETAEPAASRGILLSSFLTCAAGRYSWKIQ